MKEEWLFSGAVVPVDVETTSALVAEIKRLIDVVGGMALTQREWVGLTGTEINHVFAANVGYPERMMKEVEVLLKDKNT